jgi:hypothetical protein
MNRMRMGVVGMCVLLGAAAAQAAVFEAKVPFSFDQWFDVAAADGPVTLHRIRIVREKASAKSRIMRPGNSEHLQDVQIQLEYTNDATRDWDVGMHVDWLDEKGVVIDGYNDDENLDSESRHDEVTVTLSTLRYGLDRARTLAIRLDSHPE